MFTDGELEELHLFASKIGMKREWIHNSKHPHYDLTPSKRKLAIEYGAIETTARDWVRKERANIVSDAMAEAAFDILDPEFYKIEKEILDKIDEEAFASGGIYTPTANTFGSNPPCSLTMKDLQELHDKLQESIPQHKLFYENVVNEAEIEILLPDAVDIKRDQKGKIISFKWWGVHFTPTKYIPKGTIYSFNPEAAGIVWPKKKEE
jgi:hypothetical protein